MISGLLAAVCASAIAILPTVNRDHDQDEDTGPIRAEGPSLRDLKVTPGAIAAAREGLAGRRRIAVLPFGAPKGDHGAAMAALGSHVAITHDLHYVPAFLVLDRSEVLRALVDAKSPSEVGRTLGARVLIRGTLRREEAGDRLEAEMIEVGPAGTEDVPMARASAGRPAGRINDLADAVLLDLLRQVDATPAPERVAEMSRVPTTNDSARTLCEDGFALMDRATGLNRGDHATLTARALKDSEAALKADPRYLRAMLLRASCLLRMGEIGPMETCLTVAFELRPTDNRVDVLTRQELDGDHATFVKHDFATAVAHYERMLEIDPGHLHALWMLTALHAGEYEASQWSGANPDKAGTYAARLIVAHPGSAATRIFVASTP